MSGCERILATLAGEPTDSLAFMPITMMFAATLSGIPYKNYATDYRCLTAGQMRVADEFDIDHLNTMSDPACEAADCGAPIKVYPDQPPALDETRSLLSEKSDLLKLKAPDPAAAPRMSNRLRALQVYSERSCGEKLIEGWVEGPCAQGANLRGINRLMTDFYDDPAFVEDLFQWVVEMELMFAKAQIEAGAELIGIGDAAASLVGPRIYHQFVWPHQQKLVDGIHELGGKTRLHICGDTRASLSDMGKLGCDLIDLDSLAPISEARAKMPGAQSLLGNIDPVRVLRDGTPEQVYEAVGQCHRDAGGRYVVGAGCEVPRDTPHENVKAMLEYARSHSNI